MSRCITFCHNSDLMLHHPGSWSIFLFVYGLMLGRGIVLGSHKKAKVFIIAPGSKHTVEEPFTTFGAKTPQSFHCHSSGLGHHWASHCQSSMSVWWCSVLGIEIIDEFSGCISQLVLFTRPVGLELLVSGLIASWPHMKCSKRTDGSNFGSFWFTVYY